MTNYRDLFKTLLKEADLPDFSRNKDDVRFSDELAPEQQDQFNVDPMDPNVGFESGNITRDVEELKSVIEKIESMAQQAEEIGSNVASLERSFSGITNVSNSIGRLYQNLHDLSGELGKFIISLPAQQLKKKKESESEGGM